VAAAGLAVVVAGRGHWGWFFVVVGLVGLPLALRFPALGWFLVGALSAAVLWLFTIVISRGSACGAFDGGPDTPAQERYCNSNLADVLPFFPVVVIAVGTGIAMYYRRGWPLLVAGVIAVITAVASLAALP
jgi:hypothetical protein